jgi:putative Mg2+ transporter-C (MgtC) family protein
MALDAWELALRLTMAGMLGAALGFEREIRNHPAGVSTHALVALGAALFTLAGAYGFADVATGPNVDPARLAAQVASGIGFIGAGCIIKGGASVRGLTTAATLWLSAAVGVACAAGAYSAAAIGAGVVFVVLVGLRLVTPAIVRRVGGSCVLEVEYERGHGTLGPILRELEAIEGRLGSLRLEDREEGTGRGIRTVTVDIRPRHAPDLERLVEMIARRPEVRHAGWAAHSHTARGTVGLLAPPAGVDG